MKCVSVSTEEEIRALAQIADEIWHEYWPDHIGLAQTEYMVDRFQSEGALTQAIFEEGYSYYILEDEDRILGYTGVKVEKEEHRLFLSKLYLFEPERGKGYASEALRFLELLCWKESLSSIYLTVNKGNDLAIGAYEAMGFDIVDSVEADIGGGFIMDDYIMEKLIS